MSSAKSRTEATLEASLLAAREGRQEELHRALARLGSRSGASLLLISANVPGADKLRPGLVSLLQGALAALNSRLGLELLISAADALGPFHLGLAEVPPNQAKQASVELETAEPWGRVLDIDVYGSDGAQVDRASLGLAPRACLLCGEPARECILLKRHPAADLVARTDVLIQAHRGRLFPECLAVALHQGALRELELTPKPGLVDRHDSGSHPDLTFQSMVTSANLLPRYYEDLLRCLRAQGRLEACVRIGQEAEHRMLQAIQSNGHKGYLFLSGLLLMAAWESQGSPSLLRAKTLELATQIFRGRRTAGTHGARLRADLGLGGIQAEVERGLPAVFEHGWPGYRSALAAGWEPRRAAFHLLAVLMTQVEDTTTVRRGGLSGLRRLRQDGHRLLGLLERGEAPEPFLTKLNLDYRQANLTMGGVADCLALTFALQDAAVSMP